MMGDSDHQSPEELTARIVQRLRDVEIGCEIVNLVPTQTAVLRRDRIVILIALGLLTGLAWSYLLWLSADMSMGGMDMTGFRMIPSGRGLMIPADMPWRALEFAFVFAMWTVMMVGMMTPSAAPMIFMYARGPTNSGAWQATRWYPMGV
jgi:predicted metal-binding membrane protein